MALRIGLFSLLEPGLVVWAGSLVHRLQELRTEIGALKDELGTLQAQIETDVEKQNGDNQSLFSTIRLFFSEIVDDVIDRKALLSVIPNTVGHLEF